MTPFQSTNYFEEIDRSTCSSDLNYLARVWWGYFETNPKGCLEDFRLALLKSAGVPVTTFDIYSINPTTLNIINSKDTRMPDDPPVFVPSFCKKFKAFLDYLLPYRSWKFCENISVFQPIFEFVSILRLSPWNSIRAVAFITGLRLMTHMRECLKTLEGSHSNSDLMKVMVANKYWLFLSGKILRYVFRDKVSHIRTIGLLELKEWSQKDANFVLLGNYIKPLQRSLSDVLSNKKLAVEIIKVLFMEPLDLQRQEIYFNCLRNYLIAFLTESNFVISRNCLKIINLAHRLFDCKLTFENEKAIFMCLYNKIPLVANGAKNYIIDVYLHNNSSVNLIDKILNIYHECPVKSSSVIVSHMFDYLSEKTYWEDWLNALNLASFECAGDYFKFFHDYAALAIEKQHNDQDPNETCSNMKDTFNTLYKDFLVLMYQDKVTLQPQVLGHFLKIVLLFEFKQPEIKKNLAIKIIDISFQCQDFIVMKECFNIISSWIDVSTMPNIVDHLKKQISTLLIKTIEFINDPESSIVSLIVCRNRIILLMKHFQFKTDNLWQALTTALCIPSSDSKVLEVFIISYNFIINERTCLLCNAMDTSIIRPVIRLDSDETHDFDLLRLKNHFIQFKETLLVVITENHISSTLGHTASRMFAGLIEMFGNHLLKDRIFSKLAFTFKHEDIGTYVQHCSKLMLIKCSESFCCLTLKACFKLIKNGQLDVMHLKAFFQYICEDTCHSKLLVEKWDDIYLSTKSTICSTVLMNGLISYFNENRRCGVTIDDLKNKLLVMINFVLKNSKISRHDYQPISLSLYLCLQGLINKRYTAFSGVMEVIKATLNQEIFNALKRHTK